MSTAGFITGKVTERSGRPIASAHCELKSGAPSGGFVARGHATPERSSTVLTGEDGTFRLEAGAGSWTLLIEKAGYAPRHEEHVLAGDDLVVRLDPVIRFGVSVVTSDRVPVPGADVVVRPTAGAVPEDWRCRLTTDANGFAETLALTPGTWMLSVRHLGHVALGVPVEIPRGVPRFETEIVLHPGTRLVGTVRDEAGDPIAEARVRIESPYRTDILWDELTTDAQGRYSSPAQFALLETLEVVASAGGFAESQAWLGIQPHDVAAGEAVQDFVLPRSGRTVRGLILAEHRRLPGASVRIAAIDRVGTSQEEGLRALRLTPSAPWMWQGAAQADDLGAFELTGLSLAPQYVLLLLHESFAPRVVWVPPGEPGSVTELGELELVRCGSLFGRVVRADGTPAEGEVLSLAKATRVQFRSLAEVGLWRPDSWHQALETVAGAEGRFRFDLLAPGTYHFLSVPAASAEVEAGRSIGPVEIVLPEDPETRVVTGVARSEAEEAIPLVFLRAFEVGASGRRLVTSTFTDAHGAFTLRAPVGVSLDLAFVDLGGGHEEEHVSLDPGHTAEDLQVVLHKRAVPMPPIDGLVFDPRGDTLEGCTVTLHPPEDSLCGCITFHKKTDAAGAFRFSVAEGPHRLIAADPRYASATYAPAWPGDHVQLDLGPR